MRIVVLAGGISTERQVSLVSGTEICQGLRSLGHQAILVDLYLGLPDWVGRCDDAFAVPDGFCGAVSIGKDAPALDEVRRLRQDDPDVHLGPGVLEV